MSDRTRYAYDLEFLEDGRTIELISIGVVAEDGREFYAVNSEMPEKRIRKHSWLMENVVPGLPKAYGDWRNHMPKSWLYNYDDPAVKRRGRIAVEVKDFLLSAGEPELWANWGAYDHVALAQLWGPMINLPEGIPMFTHDIQQEVEHAYDDFVMPEQTEGVHNALDDARHNMRILKALGVVGD